MNGFLRTETGAFGYYLCHVNENNNDEKALQIFLTPRFDKDVKNRKLYAWKRRREFSKNINSD